MRILQNLAYLKTMILIILTLQANRIDLMELHGEGASSTTTINDIDAKEGQTTSEENVLQNRMTYVEENQREIIKRLTILFDNGAGVKNKLKKRGVLMNKKKARVPKKQ